MGKREYRSKVGKGEGIDCSRREEEEDGEGRNRRVEEDNRSGGSGDLEEVRWRKGGVLHTGPCVAAELVLTADISVFV